MPTFDFTSPDGKSYSVDGPDGATKEQAFQILQQQLGNGSPPQVGIGEDLASVAKAAPGRMVAGLAGLPADIAHMYATNPNDANPLGSQALAKDMGSGYEAQRGPGSLLQTAGDFVPALVGGPESLAVKALTRVVAPAVASEAGKAIGGPIGGIAGALVGGASATAAARKFQEMAAARQAVNAAPAAETLLKTAGDQFNQARDMNMIVKPDFATNAASDMRSAIKSFDPEAQSAVFKAADRLENLGASGPGLPPTAVPMNDVENIRKQLVSLKTSPDASTREAARRAITSLQDSQKAITAADVLSGNAPTYTKLMGDAIGNYAAGKRSNTVMGKIALGTLNADTAGAGANIDNALRQAIKQLVRPVNNDIVPKAQRLGFNQPEIAAMNTAARGTMAGNTARYLGKYAPTGIVSTAGGVGLGHLVGGPLGGAIPAVGYIAKKIGDLSTKRAVAAVDSLVRSRSPLAAQVAAQLNPVIIKSLPPQTQALLTALLAADSTFKNADQPSQPVGQPATY